MLAPYRRDDEAEPSPPTGNTLREIGRRLLHLSLMVLFTPLVALLAVLVGLCDSDDWRRELE